MYSFEDRINNLVNLINKEFSRGNLDEGDMIIINNLTEKETFSLRPYFHKNSSYKTQIEIQLDAVNSKNKTYTMYLVYIGRKEK